MVDDNAGEIVRVGEPMKKIAFNHRVAI